MILGATPLSDNSAAGKDYYQSMIVAAVIAGVAILAFLVVTGVYLKRTTTYKAIISGDQGGKRRKATFANRAFKVCFKVHIFLEGHQILRNLHHLYVPGTASQIIGGDFTEFCGLLRMYEL